MEPSEHLGHASQALATTSVSAYSNTTNTVLTNVNGRKTVGATNGLHTVWARAGVVYYSTSADGVSWSAPLPVDSTTATMPAIAAASDGTVGVVYVRGTSATGIGQIYYRGRSPGGGWGTAFRVTTDNSSLSGTSPSIAIQGTNVHLAWVSGIGVPYASFPLTQTSASGGASNIGFGGPICSIYTVSHPSIAVSDGPAGGTPVVRIAYFQFQMPDGPNCNQDNSFGIIVMQKPSSNSPVWQNAYYGVGTTGNSGASGVSLSLAANPATGDFYLAASSMAGSTGSTRLMHENAHLSGDAWTLTSILPAAAMIDVVAKTRSCDKLFRIAFSPLPSGNNGYGAISYRTGTWTDTAPAPTWLTSTTEMHPLGRAGSALLWTKQTGISSIRDVYSLFETWEGSGTTQYSLLDAYDTKPLPSCSDTPGPIWTPP